jgi:hypothetical protein
LSFKSEVADSLGNSGENKISERELRVNVRVYLRVGKIAAE